MPTTAQVAKRYSEIAGVLLRHGLGFILAELGLQRFIPLRYEIFRRLKGSATASRPEQIRKALEELGPTFIKLGQILSTRPDLIPPEYVKELQQLQDNVPPISFSEAAKIIDGEIGAPPDVEFDHFDRNPVGSASIGQVYSAELPTGEPVAVKVQRPGLDEIVETDLVILGEAADAAERMASLSVYDIKGMFEEFAFTLRNELDYTREARNVERFRGNFMDVQGIQIPKVYWEYTTSKVLTLDRLEGPKITDIETIDKMHVDRRGLAERFAAMILDQIFEYGAFQGDPHGANFVVMKNGDIGVLDFGMISFLDQDTKETLIRMFIGIVDQDPVTVVDQFLYLGAGGADVSSKELQAEIMRLLIQYRNVSLRDISVADLFGQLMGIARRHRLHFPTSLTLLARSIGMAEGAVLELDPDFKMIDLFDKYARRIWLETFGPRSWPKRAEQAVMDLTSLGARFPRQISRIFTELSRGNIKVVIKQPNLNTELGRLEAMFNRLSLSIVVASFFAGITLVLASYRPAGWERLAAGVFYVGLILAISLAIWLIASIFRSRAT